MESNVSVLLEQVDVEALGLLLRHSEHGEGLSGGKALSGESALVWDWLKIIDRRLKLDHPTHIVLATPVNVVDENITVNGEVSDGRERHTVLVLLHLLLIHKDLELGVVGADADVDVVALLVRVRLALFLAPLSLGEGVEDEFALVEADGDVERHIVSGEVSSVAVKVDGEAGRITVSSGRCCRMPYRIESSPVFPFTMSVCPGSNGSTSLLRYGTG